MEGQAAAPLDLRTRRAEDGVEAGGPHWVGRCRRRPRTRQEGAPEPPAGGGGGGGEEAPPQGGRARDGTRIPLPPRKRPYRQAEEGKTPIAREEEEEEESRRAPPPAVEQPELPRLKLEPGVSPFCQRGSRTPFLLPTSNGYPLMESIYLPYALQLQYYP
ncbi:hypothetical protein chiPu_0022516, partial [Chiloscyllium punctatum]|nr:hypothetical protein [Chiloscyllium punctatum]